MKSNRRIDIMTDIETLGTGSNPPVFQIAACAFNITTGEIIDKINLFADVKTMGNIEGGTLLWWLNTNKELLAELLNEGNEKGHTEKECVESFVHWIKNLAQEKRVLHEDVYLWGNGILFDATRLGLSLI